MASQYSKEAILAKADWEGSLSDALDWFAPNEVPTDIQVMWSLARGMKESFEIVLAVIQGHLESE